MYMELSSEKRNLYKEDEANVRVKGLARWLHKIAGLLPEALRNFSSYLLIYLKLLIPVYKE